jgi:S-(hydroxymethyl)glutathione dehydrogenase/alcohol dehydrogenase
VPTPPRPACARLPDRIRAGQIDPGLVIGHRLPLEDAAEGHKLFEDKRDEVAKVVRP